MSLKWSTSDAVFVTEIDDEHKEIFKAAATVQEILARPGSGSEVRRAAARLTASVEHHFAHEERLMRAARYGSIRWHKQQHTTSRKRLRQFERRIEDGDTSAANELLEYLVSWLPGHAGIADRMMGAYLRNQERCMGKLTIRTSTKPMDACTWVDVNGNAVEIQPRRKNS